MAVMGEGFRGWFGRSKVVDEKGEPLVVFHGTAADIDSFEESDGWYGTGVYFTDNARYASEFAEERGEDAGGGANVVPAFLRLERPYLFKERINDKASNVQLLEELGVEAKQIERALARDNASGLIRWTLERMGHDGLVVLSAEGRNEYVAFAPDQVKSAVGNSGAYEPTDDRIAFQRRSPFVSALEREIETLNQASAPAEAWRATVTGLVNAGKVKADEVEWSGLLDWLDLQRGRVSKASVVNYVRENGVRITEVVLAEEAKAGANRDEAQENLRQLREERDRLKVELDAAGYDLDTDYEGLLFYIERRRDGVVFEYEGQAEGWISHADEPEPLEAGIAEKATRFGVICEDIARQSDQPVRVARGDSSPRYGHFALPNGVNYREVLLTLPERNLDDTDQDGEVNHRSRHWGDVTPNVLAHVRLTDRSDADGKRVLFVEEIQSDWAQEGRRRGFMLTAADKARLQPGSPEAVLALANGALGNMNVTVDDGFGQPMRQTLRPARIGDRPVAAAPFVGRTDAWVALAVKRVIKMAVEEGYERVGFVNGQQSVERYDLSKHIKELRATQTLQGHYALKAVDTKGRTAIDDVYAADALDEVIGKDLADKVMEAADAAAASSYLKELPEGFVVSLNSIDPARPYTIIPPDQGHGRPYAGHHATEAEAKAAALERANFERSRTVVLSGLDLRIGGEGMVAFYDGIVPKVARDVLKKLGGGALAPTQLRGAASYEELVTAGKATGLTTEQLDAMPVPERKALVDKHLPQQLAFDVTDAMRAKVAAGIPAFQRTDPRLQGRSWSEERVRKVVEAIVAKWENAPDIEVIRSFDDAPHSVRQLHKAQHDAGAKPPSAFVHGGKAFIVADQQSSAKDVVEAVFHEAIGHWGLRGTFGERLGVVLDDVALRNPEKVEVAARAHGLDLARPSDRRMAAEEVLAELAEKNPSLGYGKRAVVAVRGWMREYVPIFKRMEYTDDELVQRYVAPAKAFVERGERVELRKGVGERLGEKFRAWFGGSKVVDGDGKPLVVYHGSDADIPAFSGATFFTDNPDEAVEYGAAVYPAYVRIERPKLLDSYDQMQAFQRGEIERYEALGYDGFVGEGAGGTHYVAFRPEQIKSAVGNNGEFSRTDRGIAFQRADREARFRAWFDGSKVVDGDGLPKVMYHASVVWQHNGRSHGDIHAFDRLAAPKNLGRQIGLDQVGIWFSDNPSKQGGAGMYVPDEGGVMYPVYLSIKSPWTVTFSGLWRQMNKRAGLGPHARPNEQGVDAIREWMQEVGIDGIHVIPDKFSGSTEFDEQDVWVALEPEQIKSAIGNVGEYNPNDARIAFQRRDHAAGQTGDGQGPESFGSYKALVATAERQAEFLAAVVARIERGEMAEEESLSAFMRRTVSVGGKPFSQVDHLMALESESDGWDFDAMAAPAKAALVRSALALKNLDRGYDIPHFILGFHALAEELGADGMRQDQPRPSAGRVVKDDPYPVAGHVRHTMEP